MKILSTVLAFAALAAAQPVVADCTYPKAPNQIPEGATASKETMLAGIRLFRAYNEQVQA